MPLIFHDLPTFLLNTKGLHERILKLHNVIESESFLRVCMFKMSQPMRKLSINKFTDFQTFLITYAGEKKRNNSNWSYSVWAKKLGLKDKSSIGKVLQGTRIPGKRMIEKLKVYFDFTEDEEQYFKDLISLKKVKNDARLSAFLLEKIGKDHPDEIINLLDFRYLEIISKWHCTAIREMTRLKGFVSDSKWISKKLNFKVSYEEIGHAIKVMLEAGLIQRDKNGEIRIKDGRLKTRDDIASEAIRRYHRSMLENAKQAITDIAVGEREFTASTLTIRRENIPLAKEFLRETKNKFCRMFEEDQGDGTFQIQIQFFPLTKK